MQPDDDVDPGQPGATVMVVRDADPGVEVFMLRRTLGAAFAAGMFVFPGGRVDSSTVVRQSSPTSTASMTARHRAQLGVERGGLAFWVAAIRECFEESGLLLARARSGGALGHDPADRAAVHRGELSMIDLCRRHGLVLDAGALRYVGHWVTPIGETPRRFDTRFFLAVAPPGQDGVHDEAETVESRWVRPAEALRDAERGDADDDAADAGQPRLPRRLRRCRRRDPQGRRRWTTGAHPAEDPPRPRRQVHRLLDARRPGLRRTHLILSSGAAIAPVLVTHTTEVAISVRRLAGFAGQPQRVDEGV